MALRSPVSTKQLSGHVKRAQARVEKAISGTSREDVFIKSVLGAVCVSAALRLLRISPISKLVSSVAPMVVFTALMQRSSSR